MTDKRKKFLGKFNNCLIDFWGRSRSPKDPPLIYQKRNGPVIANLDGWALVPRDIYETMLRDFECVTVYSNGETDDTPAIQAFFDGRIIGRSDGRKWDGKTVARGSYIARRKATEGASTHKETGITR